MVKKIIFKIRMYLVWILIPKSELRTPAADAERVYRQTKETWGNHDMSIYFAVSSIIYYRFPNPQDIFEEALEYSKRQNPSNPDINDFKTFRAAAEWIFWWNQKTEKEQLNNKPK